MVEIAVKLVYQRIYTELRNKVFYSLPELNAAIWELLDRYNKMNFSRREYSRYQVFHEVEKMHLNPLPEEKYEIRKYHLGTVHKNCHVLLSVDQHYYSVPHNFIGKRVKIKYTAEEVWIYHQYEQIAYHRRDKTRYGKTTNTEHLTKAHQAYLLRGPEEYLERAKEIGENTHQLIEKVLARTLYLEQNFQSCQGILQLSRKVGPQRLEMACKRALAYDKPSYTTIQTILEKGLEKAGEETKIIKLPGHDNIRGNTYYK